MRFLIVDDSEAPLRYLEWFLTRGGHEVIGMGRNGQEAVELFERLQPDVVVMDVIMPRLNGLDALDIIHRMNPQAKVVIASALRSCETAVDSERRGASYFLCKPFQESQLGKVLNLLEQELESAENGTVGRKAAMGGPLPST